MNGRRLADMAAIILAVGLSLGFVIFCVAALYDAIAHPTESILSENATQVLSSMSGGIVGILGAYVGYRVGRDAR